MLAFILRSLKYQLFSKFDVIYCTELHVHYNSQNVSIWINVREHRSRNQKRLHTVHKTEKKTKQKHNTHNTICVRHNSTQTNIDNVNNRRKQIYIQYSNIDRIRIISIPSKNYYFRLPDHVISMECSALNFQCQCTQQKLQSICAVLTFDHQLKKILTFSVKDRYQLNYFICIKDFNAETITSLELNLFSFFICGYQHHQRKTICPYVYISVRYQTDSEVLNTSIYLAVSLASPYYNYL